MPFVSKSQQRLCYALRSRGRGKGWDCSEWSEHTNFKKLPQHVDDAKPATEEKKADEPGELKGGLPPSEVVTGEGKSIAPWGGALELINAPNFESMYHRAPSAAGVLSPAETQYRSGLPEDTAAWKAYIGLPPSAPDVDRQAAFSRWSVASDVSRANAQRLSPEMTQRFGIGDIKPGGQPPAPAPATPPRFRPATPPAPAPAPPPVSFTPGADAIRNGYEPRQRPTVLPAPAAAPVTPPAPVGPPRPKPIVTLPVTPPRPKPITPMKRSSTAASDTATRRHLIKVAFLADCARAGLTTPEAIAARAEELIKKANGSSTPFVGDAIDLGKYMLNKYLELGAVAGVGIPVVGGGLAGMLAGKLHNATQQDDPDSLRYSSLAQAYDRLSERQRQQKSLSSSPAAREGRLIPMG